MPNPFPGMNPYLEIHWRDVHHRLMVYLCDALQEQLPRGLRARIEERTIRETAEGLDDEGRYPDVRVIGVRAGTNGSPPVVGPAVADPLILAADPEPITEPYAEIIDVATGNKVVTQIEILSPTNKRPGVNQAAYRRKQREVCDSDVSLVEIDLLRNGDHVLAIPLSHVPAAQRTPYMTCVRRGWVKGMAEVYPMPLAHPLPKIKVPLRQTDPDAVLDLQPLIDQCYQRAYEGDFDYNKDSDPPLSGPDAEWADALLREKGLRTSPPPVGKSKRKKPPKRRSE